MSIIQIRMNANSQGIHDSEEDGFVIKLLSLHIIWERYLFVEHNPTFIILNDI